MSILSKIPGGITIKTYAWALVIVLTVGAFAFTTVAAYRWGKENGSQTVQIQWDKETKQRLQGNVDTLDRTLKQSRTDAAAAAEQQRKDLAAALAASEERQRIQVQNAIRQTAIEAATRKPGTPYTDPRCQLDDATFERLRSVK